MDYANADISLFNIKKFTILTPHNMDGINGGCVVNPIEDIISKHIHSSALEPFFCNISINQPHIIHPILVGWPVFMQTSMCFVL